MNVLILGASGFVGKNLNLYLANSFNTNGLGVRGLNINESNFNCDVLINLIGKAHDLKNVTSVEDYYHVNTALSKEIFDAFLVSNAKVFITLSSVKAVADVVETELLEDISPNPITHYGKSKLLAEEYVLSCKIPKGKRFYILRPCMIHGIGNKGNLNLLYKLVSKGLPWPLGNFKNLRSYLSIENLCFIIKELIENDHIPSGVYNVADDDPLSTNEVIQLIGESRGNQSKILNLSKTFITIFARLGDFLKLPINSERLQKLTESYVVSNIKIKTAIGKPLPISSKEGLLKTFQSFYPNV